MGEWGAETGSLWSLFGSATCGAAGRRAQVISCRAFQTLYQRDPQCCEKVDLTPIQATIVPADPHRVIRRPDNYGRRDERNRSRVPERPCQPADQPAPPP